MGCHYLNTPFRALKLAHPTRVQASATQVFAETAQRQRCGKLLFSSVVNLLGLVATRSRKSVNEAYRAKKEQFTEPNAKTFRAIIWQVNWQRLATG